jgi:voltage-gated potassium channel
MWMLRGSNSAASVGRVDRPMLRSEVQRKRLGLWLVFLVTAFATVTLLGALGYWLIEGWDPVNALYQSVITVTTVGLEPAKQLTNAGKIYTVVLVLAGVAVFSFSVSMLTNYLITGEIRDLMGMRRMTRRIEETSDHFIVCGYGRMGREVAREFHREKKPVVVIDRDAQIVKHALDDGHMVLHGDAESDEVLKGVGVARARGLVSAMDDDAVNLMVVLSARVLNPDLFIVSRMNVPTSESKLITAGANRVLSPYGIGGRRMAQMAVRPNVVEFLEVVTHDEELEMWLEDVTIAIESRLDEKRIGECGVRQKTGANILALRKRTGKLMVAPNADTVLQAGDIIVALGTRDQLSALRELSARA